MTMPNANENTEKMDHPHFAGRSVKWYRHSGKWFGNSF